MTTDADALGDTDTAYRVICDECGIMTAHMTQDMASGAAAGHAESYGHETEVAETCEAHAPA